MQLAIAPQHVSKQRQRHCTHRGKSKQQQQSLRRSVWFFPCFRRRPCNPFRSASPAILHPFRKQQKVLAAAAVHLSSSRGASLLETSTGRARHIQPNSSSSSSSSSSGGGARSGRWSPTPAVNQAQGQQPHDSPLCATRTGVPPAVCCSTKSMNCWHISLQHRSHRLAE